MNNEKNGVSMVKNDSPFTLRLNYIPRVLLDGLDSQKSSDLQDYLYFRLSYQNKGRDMLSTLDQSAYSVILNRLSFKMNDYVKFLIEGKEKEADDFQFTPLFGATSSTDVIVAISRSKIGKSESIQLELSDIGLGVPTYHFDFKLSDLEQLEKLTSKLKITE
ncbi:hypothetical protein LZQ00_10025 [Sphingobacterium sp. SRCM116780]|uniref:hypothetical protein n=1 Tax=Sphingobacterium sp. SRCM116780 TaxID=2907623 RepID=UPI001F3BC0CE|nr:hypothetical protein [Sphingobacterium sp. SRCM116780]UIR54611.1 hypothetical protein LZQ00_10025 [Sphingobacterium sp. SRCM116780]